MLVYLILVCVVSAIVPFINGRIHWETMSKNQVILAMGRMIRHYQQTGNVRSLQSARAYAHKLQSMGGNLNTSTITILNGE